MNVASYQEMLKSPRATTQKSLGVFCVLIVVNCFMCKGGMKIDEVSFLWWRCANLCDVDPY